MSLQATGLYQVTTAVPDGVTIWVRVQIGNRGKGSPLLVLKHSDSTTSSPILALLTRSVRTMKYTQPVTVTSHYLHWYLMAGMYRSAASPVYGSQ